MVVPENPPAFRAAVICFAFCASFIVRRQSNPFNSLALAAIVLLLIKPTGIFQPDWQLSFISVLGILLFSKPIQNFLTEITFGWFTVTDTQSILSRITSSIVSLIISATAVSIAAWFANVGILLYHFYGIQYLTSFWTVLVSPLIGLVSLLGYLKLIVAIVLPTASAIMGIIINFLSDWLIWIVKLFAGLNVSEILVGQTNAAVIIFFYAFIIFAFFFPLQKPSFKKVTCSTATFAIVILLVLPVWQRTFDDNLTVTVLDVGHGQAILAQMPEGSNILFDAGSLSRSDIGTRIISPFLRYNGIKTIDSLIIGHGDIDHINGIPEIAGETRIKAVYASKAFFKDNRQTTKFLRGELQKITEINELPEKYGSSKIRAIWPIPDTQESNFISDNDKSVVTLIDYADRKILICSDVEKSAQNEILRLYPDLKADVLIMPHHGSAKTIEPAFIEKIDAAVNIASNSESAYEKHQVIRYPTALRCTGRDGAITIRISKKGDVAISPLIKEKQPAN
jgi:competence protein ComEC